MFYYNEGNEVKNCGWLDEQSSKDNICSNIETDGVYPSARDACPKSCGSCSPIPSSPTPIVPPTASPTERLTASPTFPPTASPTNPIIESPTNAPIDCSDGDLFSAQAGTRVFTKSCDWLSVGQRSNYCNTWMSWNEVNGVIYGPPAFVCREVCDSCDPCYQHENTMFYYNEGNEVKNCGWLDEQSSKDNICSNIETDGVYPSARDACPKSCGSCSPIPSSPTPIVPPAASPTERLTASPTFPLTASPTFPPTASPTFP